MSKKKTIGLTVLGYVILVFVLGYIDLLAGNWLTQFLGMILVGWIAFPVTSLTKSSVDWPSVIVGGVAVVLFIIGVHLLGRRFSPWKFRWSLAIVGVVVLLFTAGISLVGFTHQLGWLSSSGQAVIEPGRPPNRIIGAYARSQWRNNLKQIALAAHNDYSAYKQFPSQGPFTADGRMLHSWETHLLPYIAYDTSAVDMKIAWNDPKNAENFKGVIPFFVYPGQSGQKLHDAEGFGLSHIAANSWVISANKSLRFEEVTDGTSTTIFFGGINANFPAWGNPINWRDPSIGINTSPDGFGGPPGIAGVDFAMVDGSVRFVSDRVSSTVLGALSTPRGGEKIEEGDLDR